jgi:hypothetical protein
MNIHIHPTSQANEYPYPPYVTANEYAYTKRSQHRALADDAPNHTGVVPVDSGVESYGIDALYFSSASVVVMAYALVRISIHYLRKLTA